MGIREMLKGKQKEVQSGSTVSVQCAQREREEGLWERPGGWPGTLRLYRQLREGVPVIDAALSKIIRLLGEFRVVCMEGSRQAYLEHFLHTVPVGASRQGLHTFVTAYLDSLLTYGNAVGEILPGEEGIEALYLPPLHILDIREGKHPLETQIRVRRRDGSFSPVGHPEWILFTPLFPEPGEIMGRSLLAGLPFVSRVLMQIYECIGYNFERMGNLRFAVTYRPEGGELTGQDNIETARSLAEQWRQVMQPASGGCTRDFVCVGDVNIRVIGADNQMADTKIPVQQMQQEIVAKLGIPPFLLGLNWSTTERMSSQQADILTSELESYRMLLTPVIGQICREHLRLSGCGDDVRVEWNNISLQDETELAQARLLNAQAAALEKELGLDKE